MNDEKLVITVSEACKILRLSKPTVYDLCRSKSFPAIHIGRKVLIPVDGLRQWIADQSTQGERYDD